MGVRTLFSGLERAFSLLRNNGIRSRFQQRKMEPMMHVRITSPGMIMDMTTIARPAEYVIAVGKETRDNVCF